MTDDKISAWNLEGRIIYDVDLPKGKAISSVWKIPILNGQAKERTGYRTQKPLALVRRVIEASSDKGDIVLDPFCGCATACIATEDLGRQWVGIDIFPKAAELVKYRMNKELPLFFFKMLLKDQGFRNEPIWAMFHFIATQTTKRICMVNRAGYAMAAKSISRFKI